MDIPLWQRFFRVVIFFLFLTGGGTLGYTLIEGWPWIDSLYMTIITLTTVGFGEVFPLSQQGRLFTIVLILFGIGGVAYTTQFFIEYLFTTSLSDFAKTRRMERTLKQLHNHFVICGHGRVGQTAAETIAQTSDRPIVIIDADPATGDQLRDQGKLCVTGDATEDDILLKAGINRARGLIVCTGNDTNNLFIVLSARSLNPDLYIVCRSSNNVNEPKMIRAGANRVISPYQIGGQRMGMLMARPNVADVMEVVLLESGLELWLEAVTISEESRMAQRTIAECDIRRQTGVTIVLLRRPGHQVITPAADTVLHPGDELIVLGTRDQVSRLEQIAQNSATAVAP